MLGVNRKGVLPLESMLVARYQLFRAVYWHHTVRALTVMLQELIEVFALTRDNELIDDPEPRIDELQEKFRSLSDEEAIAWLRGAVDASPDHTAAEKEDLHQLATGILGERSAFFRRIVTLNGGEDENRELYDELRRRWTVSEGASGGRAALEGRRQLRRDLAERLTEELTAVDLITETIEEADLLLDVPVEDKNQVSDLFVAGVRDGAPKPIDQLTPLAKAVAEAFQRSVRPVRLYLRPSIASKLELGGAASESRQAIHRALDRVVLRQVEMEFAAEYPDPD